MSTFEIIYTYIIILIPFAVCLAAYYWLLRKALRMKPGIWKILALIFISAGTAYTIYQLVTDIMRPVSLINFNFIIIIVNAIVFTITAILMAAGGEES